MAGGDFSFEEAERRLGPAAVAQARRIAAEAPAFRPEQIAHLKALFASAQFAKAVEIKPSAAKAA